MGRMATDQEIEQFMQHANSEVGLNMDRDSAGAKEAEAKKE